MQEEKRYPQSKEQPTSKAADSIPASDDAEVIKYFESQRKNIRSAEWAACLDRAIRLLRRNGTYPG